MKFFTRKKKPEPFVPPHVMDGSKVLYMNTIKHFWNQWHNNLRINLEKYNLRFQPGIDLLVREHREQPSVPCVVIGAGPSLRDHHLLERLFQRLNQGARPMIIAVDRVFQDLFNLGFQIYRLGGQSTNAWLLPHYVISSDASPDVKGFLEIPNPTPERIENVRRYTQFILPVTGHPSVAESLPRGVQPYWYVPDIDNMNILPSVTRSQMAITWKPSLESGGNVGQSAFHLAFIFGCDPIILIGFDMGEKDSQDPVYECYMWSFKNMLKNIQLLNEKFKYRETLPRIINCSEQGWLTDPLIEQGKLEDVLVSVV